MITFLMISFIVTLSMLASSLNPVKMTMIMMIFSFSTFLNMYYQMLSSWVPMIFLMLFTGGILMVFMILSSIMPNEKPKKFSNLNLMFPMLMAFIAVLEWPQESSMWPQMKWFLSSSVNFTAMIIMITLYFFSFLYMLSKEEEPLRSSMCWNKKIFCKD